MIDGCYDHGLSLGAGDLFGKAALRWFEFEIGQAQLARLSLAAANAAGDLLHLALLQDGIDRWKRLCIALLVGFREGAIHALQGFHQEL